MIALSSSKAQMGCPESLIKVGGNFHLRRQVSGCDAAPPMGGYKHIFWKIDAVEFELYRAKSSKQEGESIQNGVTRNSAEH